jgi:hypothetical protein
MRIRFGVVAVLVLAGLLLGACATVPPSQQDERVIELIDLFNTLPAEELAVYTGLPFLFDEQVLYSQADVTAVLARLREAGLIVAPEITGSTGSITAPAGCRFDVGVFYDRLPSDARLVIAQSNAGDLSLIVGDQTEGLPRLLGIVRGRP